MVEHVLKAQSELGYDGRGAAVLVGGGGRRVRRGVRQSIEHAYPAGSGDFTLDAIRRNGDVEITVSDRGSWRPPRGHDRGRGLELIRALVDDAEIVPGSDGTTVRLRRKLCPETA